MIRRLLASLALLTLPLLCSPAHAYTQNGAFTVNGCGTAPNGFNIAGNGYSVGGWYPYLIDANTGNACVTLSGIPAIGLSFNLTGINGVAPGSANPLYVYPNIAYAPPDASTTVTTGGTFQTVFASNTSRTNCFIENPTSATEPLYVHWTTASPTTSNSASLGPGASFTCAGANTVVTGSIQITATTTGHVFVAAGA
jgi:hypothetical protein